MSVARFDLVRERLRVHLGTGAPSPFETLKTPADAVRSLCAVQAQDFLGALWAVGLRVPGAREEDVERAIADKSIVRTWPMRGTLHFVAAADVRWMLKLLTPAILLRAARRFAELGLEEAELRRARRALIRALEGGRQRTRTATYRVIEAAKVSTAGQRGIHILWRLAQEGLLCFGPREGKEQTLVLLDEWLPEGTPLAVDDALREIARRYFAGHGPATPADFAWWTGLPAARAREALEAAQPGLEHEVVRGVTYWFAPPAEAREDRCAGPRAPRPVDASRRRERGPAHLLPAFDEYLVGYEDRATVLARPRTMNAGGGMLAPTLLLEGRVVGTWRRTLQRGAVAVTMSPFEPLTSGALKKLSEAAAKYAAFLGRTVSVTTG